MKHEGSWVFLFLIMFAKFGVTVSFGLNYSANSYLFPTLFAATAIGLCNTFARAFSAVSPIISQLEEPIPMILFTVTSAITIFFIMFLHVPKNSPDELITKPYHHNDSIVGVEATETTMK